MEPQYYVFRTPPQREVYTTRLLRQYGLDVICLMRPELKRAHRRHKVASIQKRQPLPALRPYIFVDMAPEYAWKRIHEVPVDVRPVGINGRQPRPLSNAGVEYITLSHKDQFPDQDWGKFSQLPDPPAYDVVQVKYAPGDQVVVKDGPFTAFEGKCVDISGQEATVLIHLFGRENITKLHVKHLKRAA